MRDSKGSVECVKGVLGPGLGRDGGGGVGAVKKTYSACLLNLCLVTVDSHPGDGERSADNGGIPTC